MDNKLIIERKSQLKGEDGYKTFSLRIKEKTLARIEDLAAETHRSRNEIVNLLIEYSLDNYELK
ncbi:MAG: ribbon-helix-helix protein, CopG family [Eubacterium sp.]